MKYRVTFVVCLFAGALSAAEAGKTFEVASVRPSATAAGGFGEGHGSHAATGPRFGPGTEDATRWVCDGCSPGLLLTEAFGLKRFQITGPKWLDSERFDIAARLAEGSTRGDLRLMLQSLLASRFGLQARVEKNREMQVYDLVAVKSTLRLHDAASAKAAGESTGSEHSFGHGGPGGRTFTMTFHGITRHQAVGEDMGELAGFLSSQLDRPVTDSTGLTGRYDFLLTFASVKEVEGGGPPAEMEGGGPPAGMHGGHPEGAETDPLSQPPLQKAVRDQLGLRLEGKKGAADMLIVERMEKTPSGN